MPRRFLIMVLLVACGPGCARYLVETPNVLRDQNPHYVFADCPADCQSADAPVLYATDRGDANPAGDQPNYSFERSNRIAFGIANVRLHPHATWPEVLRDSTQARRGREYEWKLAGIQEVGQVGTVMPRATFGVSQAQAVEQPHLHQLLRNRLAATTQKDVYIFVHGFNTTFDRAAFRTAEVWHFMGRTGVPLAYTWPAGRGGIRGYAYDRESGEFTVGHLRSVIKTVAECPGVDRVHLVAHSRGCDITISALRELHLAYSAQNKTTGRELKLENLVLAAADVDEDVFVQRFVGEGLLQVANRTTIYASEHDRAIELSDIVFASRRRLGMLGARDFAPRMKRALAKLPNVQFIECKLSGLWIGHSYVFTHPAALSDLILVLRDRRPPGAENGRPLRQPAEAVWELTDSYLR